MQNEIAKYQSKLPAPPEQDDVERDTWSGSRCWRVDISFSYHIFLDTREKDYFLQELAAGKKIIKVGEIILTNKFLAITKIR